MHVFYTNELDVEFPLLDEAESAHCLKVLRLRPGTIVRLVDGKGIACTAEIMDAPKGLCKTKRLEVLSTPEENKPHIHIALAPTKNIERFEYFLEKATEAGISEITPIICTRSERRTLRRDRLDKILLSAMKQSNRTWLPRLNDSREVNEFININVHSFTGQRLIAHCGSEPRDHIKNVYKPGKDALVLIGPEGDFTDEEVLAATNLLFTPVSLGDFRLRTETAALYACFCLNWSNA